MDTFIAFGNDELENEEEIKDIEMCPNCNESHIVKYADRINEDGTKEKSKELAFISCPQNGESYLVGVKGKKVQNIMKERRENNG